MTSVTDNRMSSYLEPSQTEYMDGVPDTETDSEAVINYKIWKKNAPYLYDYIQTSNLIWPSLTIEWFPDIEEIDQNVIQQRILTGSQSSGLSPVESLNILGLKRFSSSAKVISLDDYNLLKSEFINVSYTNLNPNNKTGLGKISVIQSLPHRHESNKSRYMPQNPNVIASITSTGSVRVYNRTKHPSTFNEIEYSESQEEDFSDLKLEFHESEGYGLSWNRLTEGQLCTGASDGMIALWDLSKTKEPIAPVKSFTKIISAVKIAPVSSAPAHNFGLNDLEFLWCHDSIIGSVGEDSRFKLWDTRNGLRSVKDHLVNAGTGSGLNSLSWNKVNQFVVALGDSNGSIHVHDIRSFDKPIRELKSAHSEGITSVEWNNENENILASAASDAKAKLWNLGSNKGEELLFVHAGHMYGVNDISWNPADSKMLATCSDDNSVHVWKPSAEIL